MPSRFRLLLLLTVLVVPCVAHPWPAEARSRSDLVSGDAVDKDKNEQPRVRRHASRPVPQEGTARSTRQSRRAAAQEARAATSATAQ